MHNHGRIPIWFFIGVLLTAYGVIIFAAGIYDIWYPANVVLQELHVGIWWGLLLLAVGLLYVIRFYPRKQ